MFADKDNPVRCSKLGAIAKCSARIYMIEQLELDSEGGASAQTGSLTHAGVAEFHRVKGTLKFRKDAAWKAIADTAAKFPEAESNEVRLFITPYMDDPRNYEAKCLAVEREVDFTLEPHAMDSTKQTIHVQGTFDQIREEKGIVKIYDLKTGKKTGWEMIHDYAVQLAAYAYGAKHCGFPKVAPSGVIIRNYSYRVRGVAAPSPDGVFWSMPFAKWDTVDLILENVRMQVALIRNGHVQFNPGPHCTYCEFSGLTGCVPQWDKLVQLGRI